MTLQRAWRVPLLLAVTIGCQPIEGARSPQAPEAPTAQLHREVDRLRGFSGKTVCYKGQGLRPALAELEREPAAEQEPGWSRKVDHVRRAVANVERAIDAECQGTVGPMLSAELAELERALAALDR